MADKRCFVQFSHPGREHEPASGRHWNKLKYDHRRKFMRLRGKWIDGDGARPSGKLRAWGEWESESDLICKFNPPTGDARHPRYLWEPYYVPKNSYRCLHNTDPFIFGDRFLYSNCRQAKLVGLRSLDRGSVIAFGSGKMVGSERKWVLDTVLVVKDSVDYDMRMARTEFAGWASDTFLDVTGGPLSDHPDNASDSGTCAPSCTPASARLRLYRGATLNDPVDGMFSFFPAIPEDGGSGFPRPFVDLPRKYFNPKSWQAPKGARCSRTPDELRCLWDSLVAQVHDKDLVLGTYAELPERRMG